MTRYVVDCSAVLRLAAEGFEDPGEHELLAPTLIRSQVLSTLHEMVHRGELPAEIATDRLARVARIPMRLLGDSVQRRTAWKLADEHEWASTYDAEYLALTKLQGDALITLDDELTRKARGVVAVASLDELLAAGRPSTGR
ncbi:type II toxin-antitoxin system VapC family toxin [Agromyces sp. Marseille-P2726]|uniref:type II toxin-antitoxin system VapC family toxin n=1 Tax=Agromyces sp. Marseille-P2726 TaxID=2709132 RepID=UPI00157120BE|nr:type II toxin-antitoxin system VapC family toxin [Agromyces sp. Marseille-P2726]